MRPHRDDLLRLADGRALAYAEWGDMGGTPVFFFHGSPHSRLWCPDEEATEASAVHLVTVDRPGYGRSSPQPDHTLGAWPADVAELAAELGLGRFAVVGWSAGGKYAAACAALIPDRLTGAGIACTAAAATYAFAEWPSALDELDDEDRQVYELVRELGAEEAVAKVAAEKEEWARGLVERPERIMAGHDVPEGDEWFFDDPTRCGPWYEAIREALRQGPLGYASELIACMRPWGFRFADIPIKVHIWHGEQDAGVPSAALEFLVATIPAAQLIVWPDAGHRGVAKHWREILDAVTESR